MTQIPSFFSNVVPEQNQHHQAQQIPSNYMDTTQNLDAGRNGQIDFGYPYGLCGNHQRFIQQPPLLQCNYQPPIQMNGYIPQNILDPYRYSGTPSPIFILPNNGQAINPVANTSPMNPILPQYPITPCIPYPVALPLLQSFERTSYTSQDATQKNNNVYKTGDNRDIWSEHRCEETIDGVICVKKNCPVSIQLQAMISQLLGIQGIVSSAVIRILLKKISGSNVTESVEQIIEMATRCIRRLSKDDLLKESRSNQEVNRLLGIYMTSISTLPRIIPVLTSVQLKSNILKSLIEMLINAQIIENQGYGAEAPEPLNALLLELKSDADLRQLLSMLRDKECEERVNFNFAAYNSQKMIAESKLANIQQKISQIEYEMNRRNQQANDPEMWRKWAERDLNSVVSNSRSVSARTNPIPQNFESPNPFSDIHLKSPKKLILKPHVGSPETTYKKEHEHVKKESIQEICACSTSDTSNSKDAGKTNTHEDTCNTNLHKDKCSTTKIEGGCKKLDGTIETVSKKLDDECPKCWKKK